MYKSKSVLALIIVLILSFPFLVKGSNSGIDLTVGHSTAFVNGEEVGLDSSLIIIGGRTMVPVRFISEAFGYDVDWNPNTKSVHIEDKDEYPIVCRNEELEDELVSAIMGADKSIYILQRALDIDDYASDFDVAFRYTTKNNVDVKVISESLFCDYDVRSVLNGIEHKKCRDVKNFFTVIDDKYVIVGTHDFSFEGLKEREGFSLILKDPAFAKQKSTEFLKLWNELK
ncbi:MAG: stalk domain-containing protein [Caldisericia bacterium]